MDARASRVHARQERTAKSGRILLSSVVFGRTVLLSDRLRTVNAHNSVTSRKWLLCGLNCER